MCIQQAEGLIGPFDFQGEGRGRKGNTRQGGEVWICSKQISKGQEKRISIWYADLVNLSQEKKKKQTKKNKTHSKSCH